VSSAPLSSGRSARPVTAEYDCAAALVFWVRRHESDEWQEGVETEPTSTRAAPSGRRSRFLRKADG
jgi:hypothetical protein